MGKSATSPLEINGDLVAISPLSSTDQNSVCSKSNFRCIVTSILSLQLLVFTSLMFLFHGKHGKSGPFPLLEVPIAASFQVRQSPSYIQSHLQQLEQNISEAIGFPGKVAVVSIDHLNNSNWTEVTIGVPLNGSNHASSELQELKETLVKYFLREKNLSLPASSFGNISNFQLEKFPGGITVVPEPSSLSRRHVLFNFTINNTLSYLDSQFPQFKLELMEVLYLRPNEILVSRLTNLEGSTAKPPVIVQTSVFREGNHHISHLSHHRLKQLAWHVKMHLEKNMNDTIFGCVLDVELSPYLHHLIDPHRYASTPTPAPSPFYSGHKGPHHPRDSPRSHHHHHHHHHHYHEGPSPAALIAPTTHFPDLAPQVSLVPYPTHS